MILFLTAFLEEYRCIQSLLKQVEKVKNESQIKQCCGYLNTTKIHLCMIGQGQSKARENCKKLVALYKPQVIFLTGFCGALKSEAQVGDLVLPAQCKCQGQPAKELCWNKKLFSSQGIMVTVSEPVSGLESKTQLAQSEEADFVDMEACAVVDCCSESKVPLMIIKSVLDAVDTVVPEVKDFQNREQQKIQQILKNKEIANVTLKNYILDIFQDFDLFLDKFKVNIEV